METRSVYRALANCWEVLWSWYFLATANVIASLVSLGLTLWDARVPVSMRCNINNVATAVLEGQFAQLTAMQQASASLYSLEHNLPDFASPWVIVVLGLMWLLRNIRDGEGDAPTLAVNVIIAVLSLTAIGVGFFHKLAEGEALDRAGLRIMMEIRSLQEVSYDALRVASKGYPMDADQPVHACAIALDMLSARRLSYCSAGPGLHDCFVASEGDPKRKAAIESETSRWLFSAE